MPVRPPSNRCGLSCPPRWSRRLEKRKPSPANRLPLGAAPNRARLEASAAVGFLRQVRPESIVVEGLAAGQRRSRYWTAAAGIPVAAALPAVFFEHRGPRAAAADRHAASGEGMAVEVNSWGGWRLAARFGREDGERAGLAGAQLPCGLDAGRVKACSASRFRSRPIGGNWNN